MQIVKLYEPSYHVLLIGINAYNSNPLRGCVNDINLIERLLLDDSLGIGLARDRITIRRLAAPGAADAAQSPYGTPTERPTRANIVAALRTLTATVQPGDRALIYYSGHGRQQRWAGTPFCHEALVPLDDAATLYDVEVNAL